MKKTGLEILYDWIEITPQLSRSILKEKILLIQLDSKLNKKPKKEITEICRFVKPTIPEIMDYCILRNNNINAQQFYDHYESNGWLVGKVKMKNWKSAIHTWEHNNKKIENANGNLPRINRQSHNEIRQNSTGWGVSQ